MKTFCILLLNLLLAAPALGALIGTEISYSAGATTMKGYLAYDDAIAGRRPGVLVVHEWWGQNEYARKRARMLAELGYTALAVDMYGDGKLATHPEDAGKFSGELRNNLTEATARFEAAMKLLRLHPTVEPGKIAAIGYCFGGGIVLEMARRGFNLRAVASFHGSLGTEHPTRKGMIKAKLLVANGADDPFTTPEQVAAFKQEMDAADVDYRFINYPGAKHSFTNPDADKLGKQFNLPLAYNKAADEASWQALQELFREAF
jgi:dienelactone hydrolase